MTVSNNVVIFALVGLTVVSVDYYLAHEKSDISTHCQQQKQQDSVFGLSNMAAMASHNNPSISSSQATLKPDTLKLSAQQHADSDYCGTQSDHSVSWMDWVFSWQDSPTFHYLDLLELLTTNGDPHGNSGQTSPVKS